MEVHGLFARSRSSNRGLLRMYGASVRVRIAETSGGIKDSARERNRVRRRIKRRKATGNFGFSE